MKKIFKWSLCLVLLIAVGVASAIFGFWEPKPKMVEVTTYNELLTAIEGDADEIKLTSDIIIDDTLVITRKVTLNLNDKTISNTEDIWVDAENKWSLISVGANGNLTITGDGKLKAKENDTFAVDVMDGGNLTINNGEFVGNLHSVYVFEGTANINGGRFSIQQTDSKFDPETGLTGYSFVLNCYDANYQNKTAKIIVKGGEFVNFNPANNPAEAVTGTNFVAEGYTSELIPDTTTTIYQVLKIV